ncbi:MAG: hypothetical protein JKY86_07655 [Gammaproteobacteria bacterium]|nr:hypothetical protein [Gammaproteobacteria bacterium]
MSKTQRDITVTVPGLGELYVPLSDSEFIYLKESGGLEVSVIIEDASILMAEGDLRKFVRDDDGKFVDKMIVENGTPNDVRLVFTVGQGEFIRTRIFTGNQGALGTRATILNSTGDILEDTLAETEIMISAEKRPVIEVGSNTEKTIAGYNNDNIAGNAGALMYDVHTWSQYRRVDRNMQYLDPDNVPLFVPVGTTNPFTFSGSFIHPFTGRVWAMSADAISGDARFHEQNLDNNTVNFVMGLTAIQGETFAPGYPGIDPYTGNIFLYTSTTTCREYKWVIIDTLLGPRYELEGVRTYSFPEAPNGQVRRLGNGQLIVGSTSSAVEYYDTDENDNAYLGAYEGQDNVSGFGLGFGGFQTSFHIDERTNRVYAPHIGATTKIAYLFDLNADLRLSAHTNNLSNSFEHWKQPQPISGVSMQKDGGYRFLSGTILAAITKLLRGSNLIPENYLDFIYKIRFHNGVAWTTIDTARSSFSREGIPDGFKVNIDEPIFITARRGLLDQNSSSFISDNLA